MQSRELVVVYRYGYSIDDEWIWQQLQFDTCPGADLELSQGGAFYFMSVAGRVREGHFSALQQEVKFL